MYVYVVKGRLGLEGSGRAASAYVNVCLIVAVTQSSAKGSCPCAWALDQVALSLGVRVERNSCHGHGHGHGHSMFISATT